MPGRKTKEAMRFLREMIGDTCAAIPDLLAEAERRNISLRALRMAKARLGVLLRLRDEEGQKRVWEWIPPKDGWPAGV